MRKLAALLILASTLVFTSAYVAEPALAITQKECEGSFTKGTKGAPNTCTNLQNVGKGKSQVQKGTVTSGKGSTNNRKGTECTGVFNPSGSHCK